MLRQPAKVVATPPPPQPPPAPPAPLVFPQNVAKAPPSQPVPPDAIPVLAYGGLAMAPEPETPLPPRQISVRPTPPPVARVESPAPAQPEVLPAPPGTTARAPAALQSRSDRTRSRAAIEAQIRDTQAALTQLLRRNLAGEFKDDRDRATSLVELARQAIARGDLRQADDLSDRAAILAKTLLDAN
jgi:hypothetical protein